MDSKFIAIIAVAAVAVVAVAGVAIAMGGGDESSGDGRVEYNYSFHTEDYDLLGEKYRMLRMDLAIKNVDHISVASEGGLRTDFITVKVTFDGEEHLEDDVMHGVMSPGNDYVTQLSWKVPMDFTVDRVQDVELGWSYPEGSEELLGEIKTPNFVRNGSLSTED